LISTFLILYGKFTENSPYQNFSELAELCGRYKALLYTPGVVVVVVVVLAAVELDVVEVEVVVVGGQCSGIARQACKTNLSRMANSPLKSSTKK